MSGFGILPQELNEHVGNLPSSHLLAVAGVAERSDHIEIGACCCQTSLMLGRLVWSDAPLVDLIAVSKYAAAGVDANKNKHPLTAKLLPGLKKVGKSRLL